MLFCAKSQGQRQSGAHMHMWLTGLQFEQASTACCSGARRDSSRGNQMCSNTKHQPGSPQQDHSEGLLCRARQQPLLSAVEQQMVFLIDEPDIQAALSAPINPLPAACNLPRPVCSEAHRICADTMQQTMCADGSNILCQSADWLCMPSGPCRLATHSHHGRFPVLHGLPWGAALSLPHVGSVCTFLQGSSRCR